MKRFSSTRRDFLRTAGLGAAAVALPYRAFAGATQLPVEPFTFVQMCDTQLGFGGYEHDVKTFERAVKQINRLKPGFVVICGDLVNRANDDSFADFNRIKAGLDVPCYCVAGNHDIGNEPTVESLARYRDVVGKDYYALDHQGYRLVIANTQLWKSPVEGESAEHDVWFEETLRAAAAEERPVFVACHIPLFVKEPNEKTAYYNLAPEKRGQLLKLYQECGVVAVVAGHTHRMIANEYEGIQLVNGETTSKNFDNRPMGFRLWKVAGARPFQHTFVEVNID